MDIFWNYTLIFLLSSEVVTLATPVMVTISPGTQLSTKRNNEKKRWLLSAAYQHKT